eukprot:Pompholyxophrys_punicea_v1_NODE_262_length_2487_cov_61.217516.p2 type:complete len:100 gc:universal NODE_262_length_2487_cov_61.217516:1214-915(-)
MQPENLHGFARVLTPAGAKGTTALYKLSAKIELEMSPHIILTQHTKNFPISVEKKEEKCERPEGDLGKFSGTHVPNEQILQMSYQNETKTIRLEFCEFF